MSHRGGCGCDQFSGDGTGIMTAIPHDLYLKILRLVYLDVANLLLAINVCAVFTMMGIEQQGFRDRGGGPGLPNNVNRLDIDPCNHKLLHNVQKERFLYIFILVEK